MTTKKINASNTESALCYLMAHDRKVCSIDRKTGYVEMFCENLLPLDLYLEWDSSADLFNNLQVFDFNHAFEADMEFTCLPELLLGRRKSSLEAAKAAYKELGIERSYVNATDDYSKFVNDRIRILRS